MSELAPTDPLRSATVDGLAGRLHGRLARPGDSDYEKARAVYNAMHDRRPAIVARCADPGDVTECLRFARAHDLPLAVRGGGHSVAGFGTCDDGLVVDLSSIDAIEVDAERRIARVGGGCTWREFDQETHAHGLATTGGTVSSTGIAGLTLGGGFGHLTRRCGFSCDNLRSAEVVTATGEVVTASETSHPDLFWALRGGGGNFGVVTTFEYRLHPVGEVVGGPIVFSLDAAADVLRFYPEFIDSAPEDLGGLLGLALLPPFPFVSEVWHGRPGCIVLVCWSGRPEHADRVLAPLRAIAEPLGDGVAPLPYPVMNTLFDELLPAGLRHYWKGSFVKTLSDPAVDAHLENAPGMPTPESGTFLFPIDGAASRVGTDETAFGHRDARLAVVVSGIWHDVGDDEAIVGWVRRYDEALQPHSEDGTYINFSTHDESGRARANFGANYDRLVEVKTRYDPTNLFKLNPNIEPDRA